MDNKIIVLDLNFQGVPGAIASYLIPHSNGGVMVECGPGSTLPALVRELNKNDLEPKDISDVLVTHIHLDHAGAAGWLARQGARIHVHPNGAPHLINPEKLLSSAARIYGDQMDKLWGEFLSVPPDQVSVLEDGAVIDLHGLAIKPVETPGHADHHFAYLFEDVCFSGDIGGVRLPGTHHIRLPMPPPELNLEKWQHSVERLRSENFSYIAPTHFGIFSDPKWHLAAVEKALNEVDSFIEKTMPLNPEVDQINTQLTSWAESRALEDGVPIELIRTYESANPTWMSGNGIQRYWRKYRQQQPAS